MGVNSEFKIKTFTQNGGHTVEAVIKLSLLYEVSMQSSNTFPSKKPLQKSSLKILTKSPTQHPINSNLNSKSIYPWCHARVNCENRTPKSNSKYIHSQTE